MKKLFAVATLVGAVAGTAVAVRTEAVAPVPLEPLAEQRVMKRIETVDDVPIPRPFAEVAITPLVLRSGSPACGNVTHKGDVGRRRCPTTAQRTVNAVLHTTLTGGR